MHQTVEFVLRHGYAILFAMVFVEQGGLPVPASPMLLAMGALAGTGHYSFGAALVVAVAAAVAADTLWYGMGRRRGYGILNVLCRISLEPASCVRRTSDVFARYGSGALLFAKFIPGLSTVAPPLAGLTRMPLSRFLLTDAGGAAAWAGAFLGLGLAFRMQLEYVAARVLGTGARMAAGVAVLVGGYLLWKYTQRRRFLHKLRIARIPPEELQRKLEAAEPVLIVDLRDAGELEGEEAARLPGALHMALEDLEARHAEIPRDREIILYCS